MARAADDDAPGAPRRGDRAAAVPHDGADPALRGAHRGAVHARPDRRLLPPRDRRGGGHGRRDRRARGRRLPVRQLPRPRHRAGRRLRARRGDGRAVRQGDRRRPRPRRLDAPAGHRPPVLRRLGHRRRPPADRRRRRRWRSTRPTSRTPCSASSARARPTPAPSTRPSTWPPSGTCRRLPGDQQPVRDGHVGRPGVGRAGASTSARAAYRHARRAGGRQRRAGRARGDRPAAGPRRATSAGRRCWRRSPTGYRGHSVADAGKVYRTPEEITEWRSARTRSPGSARC